MEETRHWQLPAPIQAMDSIAIDVPASQVWPLIADSTQLIKWGPPVVHVDVLDEPETEGSRRRVEAKLGRKRGTFLERRILHDEQHFAMAFVIESDTFGIDRLLTDVGTLMEVRPLGDGKSIVQWSFFQAPRGAPGRLMHRLVILRQQRRNRLRALNSLKRYAETGTVRPAP
jgi:hypothetical protein